MSLGVYSGAGDRRSLLNLELLSDSGVYVWGLIDALK
jgi:hypothetical protein